MDLVGAWLRQLLKAGTAAALVPAAMVAALVAVLIGAGGFGGVGSIRQLLSGPEVPPAERLASRDGAGGADVARVAPADERRAVRTVARRASRAREAVAAPAPQPQPRRPPAVAPSAPAIVRPPPPPDIERPSVPPPPPAATPRPTLEDRTEALGEKLEDAVADLGTLLEVIVEALVKTLGRIVTPPPHSAP